MKPDLTPNDELDNISRPTPWPKLHVVACVGLLIWTVFLCTFAFMPRSVLRDRGTSISRAASTLRGLARKVPGFGSEWSRHFALFAVLMLLVGICLLTSRQSSFRALMLAVSMVIGFALFTELLQQYLVPGRSAQMQDMSANAAGIGVSGLMLLCGIMIRRSYCVLRKRTKRANPEE